MLVKFNYNQPILHINNEGFGLNRDRNPDRDWGQLRNTRIEGNKNIKEIDISLPENYYYKLTLIEDIAYAYGLDSVKFINKMIEFKLL